MNHPLRCLLIAALAVSAGFAQETQSVTILAERVMAPVRDGVKLATFIRRPETDRKVPAILSRSPYNADPRAKNGAKARRSDPAARFAFVTQDVRGRYASEGEFYPMKNEAQDGYDTIEWLARQPWCDGNVAMAGGSYLGFTQLAAAMERPPHLRAIWAVVAPADLNHGTHFYGGAFRQELVQGWMIGMANNSHRVLRNEAPKEELNHWREAGQFAKWRWHLPLADAGPLIVGGAGYAQAWSDTIASWQQPRRWDPISALVNAEKFNVPTLLVAGWYDIFSQADLDLWSALRARAGSELARREARLLMGPWIHGCRAPTGAVSFPAGEVNLSSLQMQWCDRWLCGNTNAVAGWPALRYFVMNGDRWADSDQWPPKNATPTKYFLGVNAASRQRVLSTAPPGGDAPPSAFTYDPANPVPTLGGNNLTIVRGIQNHFEHSQRGDVLGFETPPLEKDLTIAGRVRVHLAAASSAPDTDFTAMLLDVAPAGNESGRAFHANVLDGVVRARYRHGRDKSELLRPGKTVELGVDLWSTAYTFKAGHRIRLNISSSNFPRFDRNPNTAGAPGLGEELRKADNRIFHDARHLSFVEMPVERQP
ncbi:MAG: CocE/NonD family hydrolase [Verrucomicrobia bacterium]|nr:CocE/NonD family hydrolase [Verrucomicrobiota bacterium]